jgi:hypothetical protein
MADSFMHFNEGYHVIIGLVDKVDKRFDTSDFLPYELIEVDKIGIAGFEEMAARYTVIELNCAMKVFVAQYIFEKEQPDILLYLDSDMWVQYSFKLIEEQLQLHDLLLTPHFTTPLPDNTHLPLERDLLRSGVYNAGFMALKKSDTVTAFLQWWSGHMQTECYYNFAEGMGVDQVWLNLVPTLYNKTGILLHKGANVAYWNLHERALSIKGTQVMVNDVEPLLFLHISGYKFDQPEILSRHQTRFELSNMPVLSGLLAEYRAIVIKNGYEKYSVFPCLFSRAVKKSTGLMKTVNKWLKPIGIKISNL